MKGVLLTGVTGGLGTELARALGKNGWRVYGICRQMDARATDLLHEFESNNWALEIKACDLESAEACEQLAPWWRALTPSLDAFIHAAAPAIQLLPFWKETSSSFQQQFSAGAGSGARICRDLVRPFSQKTGTHIIFVLSATTLGKAAKGMGSYTVGKYALLGLANALYSEYSPQITIQCVSPSTMNTGLLKNLPEAAKTMLVNAMTQKKYTPIEAVVEKILASLQETNVELASINIPVII